VKTARRIAKAELNTLFYSPIAWLLLVVFLIQCGLSYTDVLERYVTYQEMGTNAGNRVFLTAKLFDSNMGIIPGIVSKLYLYIPLLTMGLMSREMSSGTIKLLYSAPITVRDIVLGKFIAMAIYSLLLSGVLGIYLITGAINLAHADIGLLLSILLSVFLLLCTYSSIGLFMSCLTSYQVVAAISTFVVFALLDYIGRIGQDIDFVRDLTTFLSISGRTRRMGNGLIATKDVIYFLVIMYIFLGLSILKLQGTISTDKPSVKLLKYTGLIASALLIGYFLSKPALTGYRDMTRGNTQTLTVNTQKILDDMGDEPIEVTSYINLMDYFFTYGSPDQRNRDIARWEPYLRFKSNMKFRYVYYYDSVPSPYPEIKRPGPKRTLKQTAMVYAKARKLDLKNFKSPPEIRKIIDLRPESNKYIIQLKYKGRTALLRLFQDQLVWPSESEISAALKSMMIQSPVVTFTEGQLERSPDKIGDADVKRMANDKTYRYSLINQGFNFQKISLKEKNIEPAVSTLVIADPKTSFEPMVLDKIQQYIDQGRNLLIAAEPGKQAVVNPLLEKLGIRLKDGILIQQSEEYSPTLVVGNVTPAIVPLSKIMNGLYENGGHVGMPEASALLYDSTKGFLVRPLVISDPQYAWSKKELNISDTTAVQFSPASGDEKGSWPLLLALTRKRPDGKEQRIIVSGDADFLSNIQLVRRLPQTQNFYFNLGLFHWLSNGEFPTDISRPPSKDTIIRVSGKGVTYLKIFFLGVLPLIIMLGGAIFLLRRKKK
jgi:ABC-2 type transport system permease protein